MSTVTKTFTGGESLVEQNLSAEIDFASGSNFSFSTFTSDLSAESESAIQTAGDTWESWGVPVGAVVTAVEVVTYNRSISNIGTRVTANVTQAKIVDNSGVPVTASPLINNTTVVAVGAGTVAGNGQQAVYSGNQASNQPVRLALFQTIDSNSASVNWIFSLDDIEIEITYDLAVNLAGNILSSIAYAGALTLEKRLSGNVLSSIAYAGNLSQEKRLSGDIVSSIAYDGVLTNLGVGNLRGDIRSEIIYQGNLSQEKRLSGDIVSEIAYAGVLTNNTPTEKQFSGNIRSTIAYAGVMTWIGTAPPTPGFSLNTVSDELSAIEKLIITDTSVDADSYEYKVNGVVRSVLAEPDLTRWIGLTDGVEDVITQKVTNADGSLEVSHSVLVVPVVIDNDLDLIKVLSNISVGVSIRGKVRAIGTEGFSSGWSNTDEATST